MAVSFLNMLEVLHPMRLLSYWDESRLRQVEELRQ